MRTMSKLTTLAAALCCAVALGQTASAQGASVDLGVRDHDSSTPVQITSESLSLNQGEGTASFIGDVLVRQGDMTITCGRMIVEYAPNPETGTEEINTIRMFDGVTMASPTEAAESANAVYTLADDILIMTGNVLVTQGTTALTSGKLTYNLDTGQGLMEGNVKTVLQQQGGN